MNQCQSNDDRPNPLRQFARRSLAAVLPRRLFLTAGPANSKQVCLTFDDGPHPEHTPQLLDLLRELCVKATFFLIGREAEQFPAIVRRLVREGHVLGNHTWSHRQPQLLSMRDFVAELQQTATLLSEIADVDVRHVRPPHGKITPGQIWQTWRRGETVVLWNHDAKDFSRRSAGELAAAFRAKPVQAGDVVLLHDNHPHASGALREVVSDARARGLSFTTLTEWLTPRT